MKRFFEIFRAGNYPQGTFSADDVQAIADNYDSSFLEAPITLDHGWGGPAYGWIAGLKAEGERLLASFKDVSDELTAMVANKRYKTHSVEIYNDISGKGPYLKALAMLGASSPQVKGMAPIEFSEFSEKFPEGKSATIEFDKPAEPEPQLFSAFLQDQLAGMNLSPETFSDRAGVSADLVNTILDGTFDDAAEPAVLNDLADLFDSSGQSPQKEFGASFLQTLKPTIDIEKATGPKTFTQAEVNEKLSQFEQQIKNLTKELSSQTQTTNEFKDENARIKFARRKKEFTSFLDAQTDAGKLLPKLKADATALFAHLDGIEAGQDEPSALKLFKNIIDGLPALDFDEQAPKGEHVTDNQTPPEIAKAARKYAASQKEKGHPVSFTEAVNHVKKQTKS